MANQERDKIVVFNLYTGEFSIYTDLVRAASVAGMTPTGLRNVIDDGVYYNRGIFVGYGIYFKSNRGGNRTK